MNERNDSPILYSSIFKSNKIDKNSIISEVLIIVLIQVRRDIILDCIGVKKEKKF